MQLDEESMWKATSKNILAGGVGGMCSVLIGHPFDTVKVLLQTMPPPTIDQKPMYSGAMDCARKTIATEKLRGLYKGMLFPLMGELPLTGMFFGGCAIMRMSYEKFFSAPPHFIGNFFIGGVAGLSMIPFSVPEERVKCLLQVQSSCKAKAEFKGPGDAFRKLCNKGVREVYRGTIATVLRDFFGCGLYLAVYECFKWHLMDKEDYANNKLYPPSVILAGGISGMVSWAATIPFDVVKSQIQTSSNIKPKTFLMLKLMAKDGVKTLFRGFWPVMVRAFPANAACFFGMEVALCVLGEC